MVSFRLIADYIKQKKLFLEIKKKIKQKRTQRKKGGKNAVQKRIGTKE
jgi:hypothetical protein